MNNIYSIFSGTLIGTGIILPGVSGSVIAIMLGVYDKIIYLLNDNSKNILNKIKELFPLLIGMLIGIIFFGNILLYLFKKYEIQLCYIFIGLILGGVPTLLNELKKNKSNINYKFLTITFLISLFLVILSNSNTIFFQMNPNQISFPSLFIAGILYISGKIIPGISSSFFMIVLGLYDYILKMISNPFSLTIFEYIKFIPFILGVIVGLLILIKLINYLLSNYFAKTYSAIIGFVIGSVFAIFPGMKLELSYFISIILMLLSFIFTYKMSKK